MSVPGAMHDTPAAAVRLGVIGAGRHALELAAQHPWGYPFAGRHAVITACAPLGGSAAGLDALAACTGAHRHDAWHAVVAAPDVDAVVLLQRTPQTAELIRAALAAGRAVLCPAPIAHRSAALQALGPDIARATPPAVVVAPGVLAHTPAGHHAREVLAGASCGHIESVYAAVRWHAHAAGSQALHDGLPDTAWDVLDFVLQVHDAPLARVYAHAARLFDAGDAPDTLVAIMRFADDTVFTFEAAACLPATLPAPAAGEVELELIGARESLRIEPYRTAISVAPTGAHGSVAPAGARGELVQRNWVEPPIAGMLGELLAAMREPERAQAALARQPRLAALADALRGALESGQAVTAHAA